MILSFKSLSDAEIASLFSDIFPSTAVTLSSKSVNDAAVISSFSLIILSRYLVDLNSTISFSLFFNEIVSLSLA